MSRPSTDGLQAIDWVIIVVYLLLLVGIGFHFSRKQKSLDGFIRGGRSVGWLTLGLSLMSALNSALDYVNAPAVVFTLGMVYIMSALSWILLYPWVSRVTLPFYRRLDVYSAYEYLEYRFGLKTRMVAAVIFILWRIGWMGAAIYVPCMVVHSSTGGGINITVMVIALGGVVTLYTMLGGMRAVIWTDVTQFCIMFGGLATTLYVVVSHVPGGLTEVFQVAQEAGRINLLGSDLGEAQGAWAHIRVFLTTEITLPGIVIVVLLHRLTAFTADQIATQRFQSSASIAEARRSYWVNAVSDTVWMLVLGLVGLALFAYYRQNPFPAGMNTDRVLPYFMLQHFPAGVIGLVVAAIFAASLGSVSSALNAGASVIVVDFYNRLWLGRRHPLTEATAADTRMQLLVSRVATLCLGLAMIGLGVNIERMGELFRACPKILGSFFGPLFGIFVLGMFSRKTHAAGVLLGAVVGLFCSCFASFFSQLIWLQNACDRLFGAEFVSFFQNLSWQWPAVAGIGVALIIGYVASRLIPSNHDPNVALTFAEVMKRPLPAGKQMAQSKKPIFAS